MAQTVHLVQSSTETSINSPEKNANREKVLTKTMKDLETRNPVAPVLCCSIQISINIRISAEMLKMMANN